MRNDQIWHGRVTQPVTADVVGIDGAGADVDDLSVVTSAAAKAGPHRGNRMAFPTARHAVLADDLINAIQRV